MFNSDNEISARILLEADLSPRVKQIMATCIIEAHRIAKEFWIKNGNLPKTSKYDASSQLRFIIFRLVAKMVDSEPAARISYMEPGFNNSPDYWYDSRIKLQIKKCANANKLPNRSCDREKNAQINNQISLFNSDEFSSGFVLVTYNHKDFDIQYIQLGVPDADYTRWLHQEPIMDYFDKDMAEEIQKTYVDEMEKAYTEEIKKNFGLKLSGQGE